MGGMPGDPETSLATGEQPACARNLRVYYAFAFLSEMWLLFPIWVAYLLLDRGLTLAEVALIEAPFWLAIVLAEVPTGAVADRWGRRASLVLGALLTALSMFAFGLATTLPLILLSYMVWAVALTFTTGADTALLYDTLKQLGRERDFERIAGRGMALRSTGVVVGLLSGGPVAAAIGLQETIFLSAGTMGLLAITALFFVEPPRRTLGAATLSYLDGVRAAVRTIRGAPAVAALMPLGAVLLAASTVPVVLGQPFLISHGYEVGWEFSLLQAPLSLTMVGGGLLAFRLLGRMGMMGTMSGLVVLLVGSYAGAALWDSVGALTFLATMTLVRSVTEPVVVGYVNHRIPSDQRATVLSLNQMAFSLVLVPLMPMLGISADAIDLPAAFGIGAAVIGVLALAAVLFWSRAHRSHPLVGESLEAPLVPEHAMGAPLESGFPEAEGE